MVGINLTGVFLCEQAAGRVMIHQRAGKIVNVTSVAARSGSLQHGRVRGEQGGREQC